ncbi:MAG: replication endonuclease [Mariprofundaceae bacterium]|nr:replication endonuclease [Mariprofundaceae bacterium]
MQPQHHTPTPNITHPLAALTIDQITDLADLNHDTIKAYLDVDQNGKISGDFIAAGEVVETLKNLGLNVDRPNIYPRLLDRKFLRNSLKRIARPLREQRRKDEGKTGKGVSAYASQAAIAERSKNLKDGYEWAKSKQLTKGGKTLCMLRLIKNGRLQQKARLTAKITGLKDLQDMNGWDAVLITATVAGSLRSDNTTITEANQILTRNNERETAFIHREGLNIAFVRCLQPHQDLFPHQHTYAIGTTEDLQKYADYIKKISLESYPNERGADQHRVDVKWEDRKKGRLSSYCVRYALRAIEKDGSGEDAWYYSNNKRRLAWSGLPCNNAWECSRRMTKEQCKNDPLAQKLRAAAKDGQYAKWVVLMGGVGSKKKDQPYEPVQDVGVDKYGDVSLVTVGALLSKTLVIIGGIGWTITPKSPDHEAEAVELTQILQVDQNQDQNQPIAAPIFNSSAQLPQYQPPTIH